MLLYYVYFKTMIFGLYYVPSSSKRVMNTIFFDILDDTVITYLDDVLIYSKHT